MKDTRQTDQVPRKRLVLVGALGAIGGAALTVFLLLLAFLAIERGEKEVPKIRRVTQKVETRAPPTTPEKVETKAPPTTPGTVEASKAPKDHRPEAKEEGILARESERIPTEEKKAELPKAVPPEQDDVSGIPEPKEEGLLARESERVPTEETKAELPEATPSEQHEVASIGRDPGGPWIVNAVSVHSKEGAERFQGQLEKDGWNAYIEEVTKGDRVWYLVRVGSFPSRDEAHRAGREISDWYNLGGYMLLRKSTE